MHYNILIASLALLCVTDAVNPAWRDSFVEISSNGVEATGETDAADQEKGEDSNGTGLPKVAFLESPAADGRGFQDLWDCSTEEPRSEGFVGRLLGDRQFWSELAGHVSRETPTVTEHPVVFRNALGGLLRDRVPFWGRLGETFNTAVVKRLPHHKNIALRGHPVTEHACLHFDYESETVADPAGCRLFKPSLSRLKALHTCLRESLDRDSHWQAHTAWQRGKISEIAGGNASKAPRHPFYCEDEPEKNACTRLNSGERAMEIIQNVAFKAIGMTDAFGVGDESRLE